MNRSGFLNVVFLAMMGISMVLSLWPRPEEFLMKQDLILLK